MALNSKIEPLPPTDGMHLPARFIWWLKNQMTFIAAKDELILSGSGSPNGVVTANPGTGYFNTLGGAGTTFYVKESGTGNTGWVAK